jgi:hypothetical protein
MLLDVLNAIPCIAIWLLTEKDTVPYRIVGYSRLNGMDLGSFLPLTVLTAIWS